MALVRTFERAVHCQADFQRGGSGHFDRESLRCEVEGLSADGCGLGCRAVMVSSVVGGTGKTALDLFAFGHLAFGQQAFGQQAFGSRESGQRAFDQEGSGQRVDHILAPQKEASLCSVESTLRLARLCNLECTAVLRKPRQSLAGTVADGFVENTALGSLLRGLGARPACRGLRCQLVRTHQPLIACC